MQQDYQIFLPEIFKHKLPEEFIEVSVWEKGYPVGPQQRLRYFNTLTPEVYKFIQEFTEGYHVFFGILPRQTRDSTQTGVNFANVIWADFDDSPEKAYKAIDAAILPATAVVKSGRGIHAYWLLKRVVADDVFKDVLRAWQLYLGTQPLPNLDRKFRLPGTQHVKNPDVPLPCTLERISGDGYEYDILDFAAITGKSLSQTFRKVLRGNPDTLHGHPSRSERDYYVLRMLLKSGMTEETIIRVMLDAPCAARYREPNRDAVKLLKDELSKLSGPANGATLNNTAFKAGADGTYMGATRVATFVFTPSMVVTRDDGDVVVGTMQTSHGSIIEGWQFPRSAFSRYEQFQKCLNRFDIVWLSNYSTMQKYISYLQDQIVRLKCSVVQGTRATGIVRSSTLGYTAVSSNQILSEKGETTALEAGVVLIKGATNQEYVTEWRNYPGQIQIIDRVFELLPHMNQKHVIFPILGWLGAVPVSPLLRELGYSFPILNLFGTMGSGKTKTIALMMRLLGIKNHKETDSDGTPFQLLELVSSTTGFPVSLCEFRATNQRALALAKLLRNAYDGARDRKGRPDQTVVEYAITAPIVITGEDPITDPATAERTIRALLSVDTPRGKAKEHYNTLVKMDVEAVGYPYMKFLLGMCNNALLEDKMREAVSLTETAIDNMGLVVKDRVLYSYATSTFGLLMWSAFLESINLVPLNVSISNLVNWYKPCIESALGPTGRAELQVDQMVIDAIYSYCKYINGHGKMEFPCVYDPDSKEFMLHFRQTYQWWKRHRRGMGQTVFEESTIRIQLKESLYYGGLKFVRDAATGGKDRMETVDLQEAVKTLEIPESLPVPDGDALLRKLAKGEQHNNERSDTSATL